MRSRTVREGSVGLLLLLGLGLFGVLVLWLRGTYFGDRTYQFTVEFGNAAGMQVGTPVRYRGVAVGKVNNIKPGANGVDVEIQIAGSDLAIPRNVSIEANQSGLIGENSIDIMPATTVPVDIQGANPLDPNCQQRNLVICDKERLQGRVGVSLDELIRVAVRFANIYSDPKFFENVNLAVQNTSAAAQGVTQLTRELSILTTSIKQDLRNISVAANAVTQTANKLSGTADQFTETTVRLNRTLDRVAISADSVTVAANQTANQVTATANKFNNTADQVSVAVNRLSTNGNRTIEQVAGSVNRLSGSVDRTSQQVTGAVNRLSATADRAAERVGVTADRLGVTATQASGLVTNLNNLITTNQATLVSTLNNLSQASTQLRGTVANLSPALDRVTQGEFIRNLETLSANAAQASTSIRNLSDAFNNPTNLVVLQQTLDSARVTFQNAQKITSDLDDLTGDPRFRNNLRNLVNGLSGLVSSTEQLQEQVEVAQFLAPMAEASKMEFSKNAIIPQMQHAAASAPSLSIVSPITDNKPNK